ncbi:MAG: truB [Gemmataceae bacterium]|nr:truB [Gemmataceae bacterium]
MKGLLVIDKPAGVTSRDVVNRVQKWFPRKTKIGHTGTLDPLATGVLVVCVGAATRLADFVQAMGKTYHSRFRLGLTSTTDDADGELTLQADATPPSRGEIDAAVASFIGTIEQRPPAFSALKLDGRRAHSLARQGKVVELSARPVRIDEIRVRGYEWPFLDVEIDCGKGTYIRSIARDLGEKLGVGGMVETLRRTRVGPFHVEHGVGLDVPPDEVRAKLLPMTAAVAGMPRVVLTADEEKRFRTGQTIRTPADSSLLPAGVRMVAVLNPTGELAGIGSLWQAGVKPDIVFGT